MGGKGERVKGVGWAERRLTKYKKKAEEKRFAQRGSRELRRKWELILHDAGLPGTRMRKRDSVTGAPLWKVAQEHGKSFPGPTPEPIEPNREDRFDRWAFDHVTKQHHSVQDICAKYLDPDEPSGIQGKYSYAIPRREAPEWTYFDSFLQILITQYAENPAEAAMRAACLYLAYRCGYTDKEIAERLSGEVLHERKGAVTQGQVEQCLRKAGNRAEELWPSIRDGLRIEGPTVAQRMLQRFLKSKMHCMPRRRWEPQRVHPLHAHAIGAGDTGSAYGNVEFEFVCAFDEETGRDFEKAIPTLTYPDSAASGDITNYGDSEAGKFDLPGAALGHRPASPERRWKSLPGMDARRHKVGPRDTSQNQERKEASKEEKREMKTRKNISEALRMGFSVDGEDSRGRPETVEKRKRESRLVIGSKKKRTLNLNGIKIPILPEVFQEIDGPYTATHSFGKPRALRASEKS